MDLASARRFLLAVAPDGGPPALERGDEEHALRVLRVQPGELLLGLDGAGRAFPLRVVARGKRTLELEEAGPPLLEPAPGEPGASLPRIELALSPPRGARAEELVERATQLGAAALRFVISARTHPEARALPPARAARLARVAAQACKQCGRLWLPELHPPRPLIELAAELGDARRVVLDPDPAAPRLADALGEAGALALILGPEGGLAQDELAALVAGGAARAWLAPLVLRVETAAEAALAVVAHHRGRRGQ